MKKILVFATLLLLTSLSAYAQDDFPKFELSGMAAMQVFDIDVLDNETMWGYGVGAQYNLNQYFGIVGEWAATHGESGPYSLAQGGQIYYIPKLDTRVQTLLFGPRVSYRAKPVTVFGHVLLGAGTTKLDDDIGEFNYNSYTAWQFAMAIGGGVVINLGKNFAIRPAQLDYVVIDSDFQDLESAAGAGPGMFHNLRYQLGAVFKF